MTKQTKQPEDMKTKSMQKTINLCKSCNCMTKTLDDGRCGKCGFVDRFSGAKTKSPVRKSRTTEDMKTKREWEEQPLESVSAAVNSFISVVDVEGEEVILSRDFNDLKRHLAKLVTRFEDTTRTKTLREVEKKIRKNIKRWHIRFENSSNPNENEENRRFNDEVTELINSMLTTLLNQI